MKIKNYSYIALNKPKGYVSALKDNLSSTIMELIEEDIKGLHIVGRLDKDTTGIILLTNDGDFTHRHTHPKKHVSKNYIVTLEHPFKDQHISIIESGMTIDHGKTQLKPSKVKLLEANKVQLTISEGKFHQVKKMFAALDNKVTDLHRSSFGPYSLKDLNIKEGEYTFITQKIRIKDSKLS